MDKIKVWKLISGEEIIGEVFNHYDQQIEIKSPAVIIMQQTQTGVGIALMPYMPYCEGNVSLWKQSIMSEALPTTKMVNEYNRIFGSGIEIVSAGAIQTA